MATDRRAQLRTLYYVDFPDELFAFWDWRQALDAEDRRAFSEVLGIGLVGPFDVLAGSFDHRELRYPASLHWRYQYDPPEFITVLSGDTDGLHWGYWFDDPGRLPPVVAHYYARDAVELAEDPSLFRAVESHLERCREGLQENLEDDPDYADAYQRDLAALERLAAHLPSSPKTRRVAVAQTPEGMGIVVAAELLGRWTKPATVEREAILATVEAEISAGRAGTALLIGRTLWDGHHKLAFDVLVRAYGALGREPLRRLVEDHRRHPALPSLDVLSYQRGDYCDLEDALSNPSDVKHLVLRRKADLSGLGKLVELERLDLPNLGLAAVPESLAQLSKLKSVNLWKNGISSFSVELPGVETLELGQNQLVELGALVRCTALVELGLMSNRLERLPDAIRGLRRLASLDLSGNPLVELPESLTELAELKFLSLGRCPLKRFPDFSKLKQLKRLYLVGCGISDGEVARLRAALPEAEVLA